MSVEVAFESACSPAVRPRRYSVALLFQELDGRTFPTYGALISQVLELMNAHLVDLPVECGYQDALALARVRGWLRADGDGRAVTVVCPSPVASEADAPLLAA